MRAAVTALVLLGACSPRPYAGPHAEREPNDTPSDATPLPLGSERHGRVEQDNQDCFVTQLPGPAPLSWHLRAERPDDHISFVRIQLLGPGGVTAQTDALDCHHDHGVADAGPIPANTPVLQCDRPWSNFFDNLSASVGMAAPGNWTFCILQHGAADNIFAFRSDYVVTVADEPPR